MRYLSTRGQAPEQNFAGVLLAGLADDGGLYMPESWPVFSGADLRALRGLPYPELAARVLAPFMEESVKFADLQASQKQVEQRCLDTVGLLARAPFVVEAYRLANSGNINVDKDPSVNAGRDVLRKNFPTRVTLLSFVSLKTPSPFPFDGCLLAWLAMNFVTNSLWTLWSLLTCMERNFKNVKC